MSNMSNIKETIKDSTKQGIILDTCGEDVKYYDYGNNVDLCGLDPKEIMETLEQGIILDTCGENVRYYNYGLNIDLCGLNPKEIMETLEPGVILDTIEDNTEYYDYGHTVDLDDLNPKEIVENTKDASEGSSKTRISISGIVTEKEGQYYLEIKTSSPVVDIVTISLLIDNEPVNIILQVGEDSATYGTIEKYSEIKVVKLNPTSSAIARYSANFINPNGDGKFKVKIIEIKDNVQTNITSEEHKFNTTVELNKKDVLGYNFIKWEMEGQEYTDDTISFIMPENDVEIKCYYEIKIFTITWVNYDNSILDTTTVKYNTLPKYTGPTPTKEPTVEYTFKHNGWSPSVTKATKDTTYKAVFSEIKRSYVIKFVNYNGVELESKTLVYGSTPVYSGPTPTKESTEQYNYTFDNWSPEITSVQGDAVYTATFIESLRLYEIKFINEGVVIETQTLEYGSIPVYTNILKPTKQPTEQYNYIFDKWVPEIVAVNGNASYTASYIEEVRSYIVRFLDGDGTVLQEQTLEYGSTPIYTGSTPTKQSTAEFDYTFKDWTPTIDAVKGNIDYKPLFNSIKRVYVVRFFDANGQNIKEETLEYGTTPIAPIVTKEPTPEYRYEFKAWTPTLDKVTGNVDYYPEFEEITREYTVIFKNENGEILQTSKIEYNTIPQYTGSTPTKEGDAQYSYVFNGWDKEITPVVEDTTYVATFESVLNTYTVEWLNYDGTYLEKDENVPYGEIPSFDGETPTREDNKQYSYTFKGWDKEITPVTGFTIYGAQFNQIPKEYIVDITVENGTYTIAPEKDKYMYNDYVVITIIPENGYEYSPLTNNISITGNTNLIYECTPKKYDLTVNGVLYENIEYKSDITQYLKYEPKEGMVHKWKENDKTFNGTTMPNRDLVLIGVYEEMTDNSMIYYKAILTKDINNIYDYNIDEFDSYEYTDGVQQQVTFTVSAISQSVEDEYWGYEDDGNEEAMKDWEYRHYYEYCILAPSNVNIDVKNAASLTVTQLFEVEPLKFTINGVAYNKYHYLIDCMPTTYDQPFDMFIKIN